MADPDDLNVDGKPISSLKVNDLKKQLEKRGLPKTGNKKDLAKRLKVQRLSTRTDGDPGPNGHNKFGLPG